MASIQQILGNINEVESQFKECVEMGKKLYPRNKEDATKRFMWENNLMKFYLEYDVDKACDYGHDLLHDY